MDRKNRAKQFLPFDALKGLQDALRIKEYEHERVVKGEVQEETAQKISNVFLNLERNSCVKLRYFDKGAYKTIQGVAKLDVINQIIFVNEIKIDFDNIFDIDLI